MNGEIMTENNISIKKCPLVNAERGQQDYTINGLSYAVSRRYRMSEKNGKRRTMAKIVEDYLNSEFVELTEVLPENTIREKPVCSTAGLEVIA